MDVVRCPRCGGRDAEALGARVVCRACGVVAPDVAPLPRAPWAEGRGFAALDPAERRALGARGGRTTQARGGTASMWTAGDPRARAAGRTSAARRAARRRETTTNNNNGEQRS